MRNRLVGMALLVAILGAFIVAPLGASAAPPTSAAALPVTGTLADGGSFTGTVSNLVFTNVNGVLTATGTLTGTATSATGAVTQITQDFTTAVDLAPGASCDVLFLDLGPLFLDLLGLQVDLSEITLDVNAVPGAGNLLGNLLCAVTGLLDGPAGTTNAIAQLLNRILTLLG